MCPLTSVLSSQLGSGHLPKKLSRKYAVNCLCGSATAIPNNGLRGSDLDLVIFLTGGGNEKQLGVVFV